MTELKLGVDKDVVAAVTNVFKQHPNGADIAYGDVREFLKLQDWVQGIYTDIGCVGALWGNSNQLYVGVNAQYIKELLDPTLLSKFFGWYFQQYPYVLFQVSDQIPLEIFQKLGFKPTEQKGLMVLTKDAYLQAQI